MTAKAIKVTDGTMTEIIYSVGRYSNDLWIEFISYPVDPTGIYNSAALAQETCDKLNKVRLDHNKVCVMVTETKKTIVYAP